MKPVNGFKSEAPSAGYPMLPKGLYIAGITNVKIEGTEPDQRLVLCMDIIEGEYAGYYTKRYNHDSRGNSKYEVKYKGVYRIQIPDEANTKRQWFTSDLKKFNGSIWSIEDSNDGYHWDWNENGLKGKTVGINVQYGEFNGAGFTKIGRLESVKMIRDGKCKLLPDMEPRQSAVQESAAAPAWTAVDEEVPF